MDNLIEKNISITIEAAALLSLTDPHIRIRSPRTMDGAWEVSLMLGNQAAAYHREIVPSVLDGLDIIQKSLANGLLKKQREHRFAVEKFDSILSQLPAIHPTDEEIG